MSTGVQESSTRGLQASLLNAHGAEPSQPSIEKRTKHKDDLENAKLIPSILPDFIPPPVGAVNCDSVPRDFEYTMVTAYLLKRIRAVRTEQDKITALNFSNLNLKDHKIYGMLAPYNYLTRTKGKNSNIIP
jgi:hypothetical protein